MGFDMVSDEDLDTVSDAIKFIDSFDGGVDLDTLLQEHTPLKSCNTEHSPTCSSTRSAKKRRIHPTKPQKRSKEEIQVLQHQVQVLQKQLNCLMKRQSSCKGHQDNFSHGQIARSNWQNVSKTEYEELQRSQSVNAKLKSIFSRQQKLDTVLRRAMKSKVHAQSISLVFEDTPTNPCDDVECSSATITQLEDEIAEVYMNSSSQFPFGSLSVVSSTMKTKQHSEHGMIVEITSTTPLQCEMNSAAEVVWKTVTTGGFAINSVRGSCSQVTKSIVIDGENGPTQAKESQLLRKFEETKRKIIVKAGVINVQNVGPQLRHRCCISISPSAAFPDFSVVQAREHLYWDHGGFPSTTTRKSVYEAMMRNISLNLRKDSQMLQDQLIDEVENFRQS